MSINWISNRTAKTNTPPAIRDQLISITDDILCLRNPWRKDSVFMGKMHSSATCAFLILALYTTYEEYLINPTKIDIYFFFLTLPWPLLFLALVYYRISFLKNLSDIYFLKKEQKIIYKRYSKIITFKWKQTEGGAFLYSEPGGGTQCALAFAPRRADGTLHKKDCLWVESNDPARLCNPEYC